MTHHGVPRIGTLRIVTLRIVTLWCPDWPVVAAGADPDQPAAVLRANRITACTPAARAAGVGIGTRRRAAQAICPELSLLADDPDRDARQFEPIVRAIADLAPRVEVVEPGWLCIGARGPSRYFGGDDALAALLAERAGAIVGPIGVAIADGRATSAIAARLAARRADHTIVVPVGGSPAFVQGLPIGWLQQLGEVEPELIDLLARLGIRTLGALAGLDVADVAGRFGAAGLHAYRLAGGHDDRPASTLDPSPSWWVEHSFDEPVEQLETVVFVVKRLADEMVARLAAAGRVCVRLVVLVETEHGERSERAWYRDHGLSAPAIVERARWQLDGWARQGGSTGGVTLVRLFPDEVRSDDGVQTGLWGGRSAADDDAARAVTRLIGLAGEQAVGVPAWQGGRLPAERYRLVTATSVELDAAGERLDRGEGPWPGSAPVPSPAVVHPQPIAIDVLDADGAPVQVSGRGEVSGEPAVLVLAGRRAAITAWAGPWPVDQCWWSSQRARRLARFQLVTEHGAAHLAGVEQRRWTLLATYA